MMIRKIINILLLFAFKISFAQETLPVYQQYLLDGKFLINPANVGETDDFSVNANYQKQFIKFGESPNVQSVGIHANVFDRMGAGLTFFRDENGPVSANGIAAAASYFIPLGDEERRDQFSFGAAANFYNMSVDYSRLKPAQPNDPLLYSGSSDIFIAYANLGIQATYASFFAGASVLDILLSNDIPVVNGIEPSPMKILLNAGYDWQLADGISIEPSVLANLNTNSATMYDLNLLGKVYSDNSMFAAGVSFRTEKDDVGSNQLSLSPIVKGKLDRFTFGAAYNIGMSDIAKYGGNSFTISIGYNFENFINQRGFRYR